MRSRHDALGAVSDIIANAERIRAYLGSYDRAAFDEDSRTRDAVERCLERICEAAHRLDERALALMPDQPWADIRGLGNRLRHAYDRIDPDIVWNTVVFRLPSLEADARLAVVLWNGPPDDSGA